MSNFGSLARSLYANKPRDKGVSRKREPVLIVDDNLEVIEALSQTMQRRYDVVACRSYAEVEQCPTAHIKVALLDVKMAPQDGLAVFSLLKQKNQEVRIIFNTAYPGDSAVAAKLRALESDGYLIKGEYSMAELEATIDRALSRSAAKHEATVG